MVIVTGGFTVTDKGCTALTAPTLSVTVTVKLKTVADATTGAVPPSVAPDTVSQAGKLAPEKVKPAVPPPSVSV